jgi:hypothetical protein
VAGSSPAGTTGTTAFQQTGEAALLALPSQLGTNNSLNSDRPGSFVPLNQSVSGTGPFSPILHGQSPNQIPSFAIPTGFPGRLIFPNTGVNVRSPGGDGPMQAPAGVFLPGGGDQSPPINQNQPERRLPPPPPPVPLPGAIGVDLQDIDFAINDVVDLLMI